MQFLKQPIKAYRYAVGLLEAKMDQWMLTYPLALISRITFRYNQRLQHERSFKRKSLFGKD